MLPPKDPVTEKAKLFAIRIIQLCQYLTDKKKEFVLSKQVLRSGTSIGANRTEAVLAIVKSLKAKISWSTGPVLFPYL